MKVELPAVDMMSTFTTKEIRIDMPAAPIGLVRRQARRSSSEGCIPMFMEIIHSCRERVRERGGFLLPGEFLAARDFVNWFSSASCPVRDPIHSNWSRGSTGGPCALRRSVATDSREPK